MKKTVSLLLALCLVCGTMLITSCSEPSAPAGTVTRMTLDLNPSIEIMIDDQETVVSVTALNDDAAILLAGENLIGKTAEEALGITLMLATEMGYISLDNASTTDNTLKLSVSGNGEYAEHLKSKIKKASVKFFEDNNINGGVEAVDALSVDALRELAARASLYTDNELAKMNEGQLCKAIAEGRVETALVPTAELCEAFISAKKHSISLAKSEAKAAIIEELDGAYLVTHATYMTAVDAYAAAIESLETFRYDTLISPDSAYQQSILALREMKTELLKQRNIFVSYAVGSPEYVTAGEALNELTESYENALDALEELGNAASVTIDSMIKTLSDAEKSILNLEETIFNDTIEQTLAERTYEIEAALFEARAEFFAEFEASCGEYIDAIEAALLDKKAELKAAISEIRK